MIQNEKKRVSNKAFKSRVLTSIRSLEKVTAEKDQAKISAALTTLYSLVDKGVKKGLYKKNKAARMKSRLS